MKITNMPVMKTQCPTCPFRPENDMGEIRSKVEERCLTEASQICHHPALKGKEQTHLCRGARNFQQVFFYRIGFIEAPTDEAWAKKLFSAQPTETTKPPKTRTLS